MDPYDSWKLATPWDGEVEQEGTFEFELPVVIRGRVSTDWLVHRRDDEDARAEAEYQAVSGAVSDLIDHVQDFCDHQVSGIWQDINFAARDWSDFDYWPEHPKERTGTTG